MLSRYKRFTEKWREESAKDMKREEAAAIEAKADYESSTSTPREKYVPTDQPGISVLGVKSLSGTEAVALMVTTLWPPAASQHHRLFTLTLMAYTG